MSRLHPTFREPDIQIHDAALDSWKRGEFENAVELLTAVVSTSLNPSHVLAGRALVRARLKQWDAAIADAKEVLSSFPSDTLILTPIYSPSNFGPPPLDISQRV